MVAFERTKRRIDSGPMRDAGPTPDSPREAWGRRAQGRGEGGRKRNNLGDGNTRGGVHWGGAHEGWGACALGEVCTRAVSPASLMDTQPHCMRRAMAIAASSEAANTAPLSPNTVELAKAAA